MEIDNMNYAYYFALTALLFWGIAPIFGKLGLTALDPLAALAVRSGIVTIILVVIVLATGKWTAVVAAGPKEVLFIAAEGICAALLGQLAYYYALKYGEVGRISPVVSAFPLIALAGAVLFLGEKITVSKVFGSLMVIAGLIILKL